MGPLNNDTETVQIEFDKHVKALFLLLTFIKICNFNQPVSLYLLFFSGDHTETVQIEFDRTKTSYEKLLKKFWANHDSTTCHKNQYMSAIFYHDEKQHEVAKSTMDEHQKVVKRKIQTKIKTADTFYDAEE